MKKALRMALYLFGLVLLALGNVLSIQSGLGVTATASFGFVISEGTGLSLGTVTILTFAAYIIAQLFLTKKANRIRILIQLPFSVFFSFAMDFLLAHISITPHNLWGQILLMFGGIFLTALGVFASVSTHIVPTAPDGIVQTISERFQWKFGNVKNTFDLLTIVIAMALSLVIWGKIIGVGIGTVVSALLIGRLVSILEKYFGTRVAALMDS